MVSPARFYKDVSVSPRDNGFGVLLDGKPIRTPAGAALVIPARALADAVAEEWRSQGDKLRLETMILTKLANTAADRVTADRLTAIAEILAFARSDLLCYRADAPATLVALQVRTWDPLLEWARERYGAVLACGTGIGFVEQDTEALAVLERAVDEYDSFRLCGVQSAATLLGSTVIALALADGKLSTDEALGAAQLDENYQAAKWGLDFEAEKRRENLKAELVAITGFLQALEPAKN